MAKIRINIDNIQWLPRAEDFIDEYQFPRELVIDVVRAPDKITVDPSSSERSYKVYQFRRGDITVVVGTADPERPAIIHVWLHSPEEHTAHSPDSRKAGAGTGKKAPRTDTQLRGWIQAQGCRLTTNGRGHYNVYWGDVLLGGIGSTMNENGIINSYSFIRKRLAVEKAKASLTSKE